MSKEEKMKIRNKSGQSILEYTLVLGAVIAVVVFVLLGQGGVKDKVQTAYERSGSAIEQTTNDLTAGVFTGTN
jgi:Flp pilus assembly pilin Flp